jgi:hypothetical protein
MRVVSEGDTAALGADGAGGPMPRAPSLLDALLPVIVLIGLIALTIALFGISATDGPLQVALLLSAAFAILMALRNGYLRRRNDQERSLNLRSDRRLSAAPDRPRLARSPQRMRQQLRAPWANRAT